MLSLIWSIFNLGLFLFAIAQCFRATKYLYAQAGTFVAVVFVLIVLSSFSHLSKDNENMEPNSNQIKTFKFFPKDSVIQGRQHFLRKTLDESLTLKYDLGISYVSDERTNLAIPTDACSDQTGFVSGITWQPTQISLNKTVEPNLFSYHVAGIVKWKLLGVTLYAQLKFYKGVVLLKDSPDY
jgi:hypothetical protein